MKPTTMLYRNLLAMETEELLRSQPIDGVVLMGGCDKTTPGLLMGAHLRWTSRRSSSRPGRCCAATGAARRSARAPTCWKYWDELRAGTITEAGLAGRSRTASRARYGTCMTMGTASTMTAIAEALGFTLPGASSIPAADAAHARHGERIAGGASSRWCGTTSTPATHPDPGAFDNAIAVAMAIGGSTNAIIHLIAMARRAGLDARPRPISTTRRARAAARQLAPARHDF